MRIRFLERVQYESEGRGLGPVYEAGSVHDFEPDFANRWLRRGVAAEVSKDEEEPPLPLETVDEKRAHDRGFDPVKGGFASNKHKKSGR